MEQDLSRISSGQTSPLSSFDLDINPSKLLKVPGIFCERVSITGPSYEEFVGVPDAARTWKVTLSKLSLDTSLNIETLRRKNADFSRVLLHMEGADLSRICSIDPDLAFPLQILGETMREALGLPLKESAILNPLQGEDINSDSSKDKRPTSTGVGPRFFATSEGQIGPIPCNTKTEDFLFQFWNSDVVAVARWTHAHNPPHNLEVVEIDQRASASVSIIGRAVLANDTYTEDSKFRMLCDYGEVGTTPMDMNLVMDMCTIKQLTC
jgi:hypothetical protein